MKPSTIILLTTACIAFLVGCKKSYQQQTTASPLSEWKPYLDQPINQIEASHEAAEVQQEMNYTATNLAFIKDAKLYILFHQYLESLPMTERESQIEEQRQWLKMRSQEQDEARSVYGTGSAAPQAGAMKLVEITDKRIAEIGKRSKQ